MTDRIPTRISPYPMSRALVRAPGEQVSTSYLVAAIASILLVPVALLGPNTPLALVAWLVLAVGIQSLWRPGEPPILLLIFVYQWIQAAIALFYGNLLGYSADHWTEHGGDHDDAILLTLIGLAVLALAIRLATGRQSPGLTDRLRGYIAASPVPAWFRYYAYAWVVSQLCLLIAPLSQGLYQPLLFLSQVKWAAFVTLTIATFGRPGQPRVFWAIAFGAEFAQSIGSYFSSFSDVFIYSLVGLAAANVRVTLRRVVPVVLAGTAMIATGVVWTAVKKDYRDFVSTGFNDQAIRVGPEERVGKLFELVTGLDGDRLVKASDDMVQRLMYFEFFGVVMNRVPAGQPHTGGEIWSGAAMAPFTPRLLFPNKPVIDDTRLTERYTGIHQAAWQNGASISLGYMGEAYIDFGPVGMFAAIAALGAGMGLLYRWLLGQKGPRLVLGAALAPVALMPAHLLESSSLKVIAPLVLSFLGCWLILATVSKRLTSVIEGDEAGKAIAKGRFAASA